jgi:hypothetical protein
MIKSTDFYWAGENKGLVYSINHEDNFDPDIVFYFFDKQIVGKVNAYSILKEKYPKAILFGTSTGGPILKDDIYLETFTGMAISFEKTPIDIAQIKCSKQEHSYESGKNLIKEFDLENLKHIFVVTDGMTVNGAHFIKGLNEVMPDGVSVSGGLASDNFDFKETLTGINSPPKSGQICAIGLYGDAIQVGYGARGGWDNFGLQRTVTKSDDSILYELDGKPALTIYKEYLGPDADNLPSSGLLFPLVIKKTPQSRGLVRTINAVDEKAQSLRFTGDIPQGCIAQFMIGNFRNLAQGAGDAAKEALKMVGGKADLAILTSCLGRQLLMGSQISDELENTMKVLGDIPTAGFYSNGEFSYIPDEKGLLHNETMTLTVLKEL